MVNDVVNWSTNENSTTQSMNGTQPDSIMKKFKPQPMLAKGGLKAGLQLHTTKITIKNTDANFFLQL